MSKVSDAEFELLTNLFSFYQKKYDSSSIRELEDKFGKAARELVESGDISEETLSKFCNDEGIDIPEKKKKIKVDSNPYLSGWSDGCGRSSYRSHC